jgi:hypothetical protein
MPTHTTRCYCQKAFFGIVKRLGKDGGPDIRVIDWYPAFTVTVVRWPWVFCTVTAPW